MAAARRKQQEAVRRRMRHRVSSTDAADGADDDDDAEELAEWADLERDDADRREVKAAAAAHARFCGEAVGICAAAGRDADMSAVSSLIADHDGALKSLSAGLNDQRRKRRAELVARLRRKRKAASSDDECPRTMLEKLGAEIEGALAALDADLESERRQKMHEFVTDRRRKVLAAVESSGTFVNVRPREEAKATDEEQEIRYHKVFVGMADAEARAADRRASRQAEENRRQKDAIARRLARRRSSAAAKSAAREAAEAEPRSPAPSAASDLVAQIEAARESNTVARRRRGGLWTAFRTTPRTIRARVRRRGPATRPSSLLPPRGRAVAATRGTRFERRRTGSTRSSATARSAPSRRRARRLPRSRTDPRRASDPEEARGSRRRRPSGHSAAFSGDRARSQTCFAGSRDGVSLGGAPSPRPGPP